MSRTVPARQRQLFKRNSPKPQSPEKQAFRSRSVLRRTWLPAFAAFALLALAWSLAMPADGTTDERQHLERAYGAVTGHLLAPQAQDPLVHRPGAAFEVPQSLLPPNALCVYFPNYQQNQSWVARAASCQRPAPATHAKVRVVSWVGRYNPLYYLAVGGPLRFWPDMTGILLSRILAALLASAFVAAAAMVAIRTRRPLLLAALLTVLTPTTIALNSTVNPNGIEISAALLLWVCLVDLAGPGARRPGRTASAVPGSGAESVAAGSTSAARTSEPRVAAGVRQGAAGASPSPAAPASGPRAAARLPLAGPGVRQAAAGAGTSPVAPTSEPRPAARLSLAGLTHRVRQAMRVESGAPAVSQPALLALAAISGAVVLTVRAEGPFWFVLAVCGSLLAAERGRIGELLRWPAARLVGAAWLVVGLAGVAWNVVSGNSKVTHTLIAVHPADHRFGTLVRLIAVNRVGGWFAEAFALDVPASWAPMLWAALAAAVLVPLAMLRSRRVVVVALGVAAASLGITVVLEIKYLGTLGWSQYGRYFLPGLAGTAVLLASGPATELPPVLRRRIPRLTALGAAVCQLWVLAVEMTRVQAGPNAPLNPLAGSWHPAVGSLAVLAVAGFGAVLLLAVVWAATAAETASETPARTVPAMGSEGSATAAEPQVVPEPANSSLHHLMA